MLVFSLFITTSYDVTYIRTCKDGKVSEKNLTVQYPFVATPVNFYITKHTYIISRQYPIDRPAQLASSFNKVDMLGDIEINWRSIKEPRGFIKFVQMFLSMLVFSLFITTSYDVTYIRTCKDGKVSEKNLTVQYPFVATPNPYILKFDNCQEDGDSLNYDYAIHFKSSSLSSFHFFMGVVAFIYCLGCIIYFLLFELDITQPGADRHQVIFYTVDIGFSLFVFVFGLIACFCAMSVSHNLSYYAKESNFKEDMKSICTSISQCKVVNHFNHSNMIASILFQLVNISVWGFSLYMMWKDQVWRPVTNMPYDNDPTSNPANNPTTAATSHGYSAAYGNDYEYTYT